MEEFPACSEKPLHVRLLKVTSPQGLPARPASSHSGLSRTKLPVTHGALLSSTRSGKHAWGTITVLATKVGTTRTNTVRPILSNIKVRFAFSVHSYHALEAGVMKEKIKKHEGKQAAENTGAGTCKSKTLETCPTLSQAPVRI